MNIRTDNTDDFPFEAKEEGEEAEGGVCEEQGGPFLITIKFISGEREAERECVCVWEEPLLHYY